MLKVDAHQHFWKFDPVRDSWITEDMATIRRDFGPEDLQPLLQQHGFDGCVLVQSAEPEHENKFLLEQAEKYDFIKGVVGWVDFFAASMEERLARYGQVKKMKGFRYVLQGAEDRALMLRPAFMQGLSKLQQYGFTYDLLIFPDQLKYAAELIAAFPEQPFVIDHLAKPYIRDGKIDEWKRDIKAVAQHENVCCKVSGMVTEADWRNWRKEDFRPYLDVVVEAFGTDRLLYGSDWPVCLLAATYAEVLAIVQEYFSAFSRAEQDAVFGGNALQFYNLS
ncbi:L-fuconolactonase [Pontibacter ummariensis]|uniref:L-fuconolactonase n=1 Tax=Pontibacter ummariensis TaxID=1610492 RepID=A0A239G573_9BACT|nr:amidohydrolase family protein [Pontibacter ummariensis]PRY11638.1 L-fuconolactonase [Pontibacter ummariensis]SNS64135.1 L-fuconolactonase [Pontibacter ummariensis]